MNFMTLLKDRQNMMIIALGLVILFFSSYVITGMFFAD